MIASRTKTSVERKVRTPPFLTGKRAVANGDQYKSRNLASREINFYSENRESTTETILVSEQSGMKGEK